MKKLYRLLLIIPILACINACNSALDKIDNNTRNKWSWASRTSDHDGHNIYAKFNKASIYTIEISGRSSGFAIDRITLYQEDGEVSGDDTSLPPSVISCQ